MDRSSGDGVDGGVLAGRPQSSVLAGRHPNYDLIRVTACLAVVLLHVSARPLYLYMQGDVGFGSWLFASAVNSLTHWCVPVFVMLSGALLLGRSNAWQETYLKRVPRLVAVLVLSIVVYGLWRHFFVGDFQWVRYAGAIVVAAPYYHLFYLYVAVGLYLITPILSQLVTAVDRPTLRAATIAACVISFAALALGTSRLAYSRDMVTIPWDYIGYSLMGYYLSTYRPRLPYVALVALGYAATLAWLLLTTVWFGAKWPWTLYSFTYFSPATYALAIGVFGLLLVQPLQESTARVLSLLAPLTLLVYLIHPMVLESVRRFLVAPPPPAPIEIAITFLLTITLSTVIAYFLRRIPGVARLF